MPNSTVSDSLISQLKLRTSYLNTTEAMELLSVSRNTLCVWVTAGVVPAIRVGRDNRFDPWELAQWLEERHLGQRCRAGQKPTVSSSIIRRLKTRTGYLKSIEVMKLLGVSRKTLCGWVRDGEIPATRIGTGNKFDPLELAHWLEERQRGLHPAVSGKAAIAA
jgi:excisionase family DNA binding protein